MIHNRRIETRPWSLRRALHEGWDAAKQNARAILLIQAATVGLVAAYYAWPEFARATEAIGPWRARYGLPLSFLLGFIAGGAVPEIAKVASRQTRRLNWRDLGFVGLVYGLLAVQIDVFYRLQGMWFGDSADVVTIVKKLAVDMGLAAPLVFIPYTVGMFLWREQKFRLRAIPTFFRWEVYRERVLTVQVMNWFVWIPVLSALYALPLPLQFPLSMLIEACWTLLVVVMTAPKPDS